MPKLRNSVMVSRYIIDLQKQIAAHEHQIKVCRAAGVDVQDAESRLSALRRSLSVMQARALRIARDR